MEVCEDTASWANVDPEQTQSPTSAVGALFTRRRRTSAEPDVLGCAAYAARGWCAGGAAVKGKESMLGAKYR